DSMTVGDNLHFEVRERYVREMTPAQMQVRDEWARVSVGLPLSELGTLPRDLSGGMQKRVGIARTIVTRPEVLLYDSPTDGLDPQTAHRISDLIGELRNRLNVTSVVVSHDLRTVFTICDRVSYLEEGRLTEPVPPSGLARSRDQEVRDFVIG